MFVERLVCSWIGALGLAAGAFCQTDLPIGLGFAEEQFPNSINEKGEVTGYFMATGSSAPLGFVRAVGGTITTFNVIGFPFETVALSINARGSITGYFSGPPLLPPNPGFPRHGFVRDPEGNFTTFDPPGSIATTPQSINTRGDVAGYYNASNLLIHGFVRYDNGTVISFDPPGSISTKSVSINFDGAIAGFYNEANLVIHGFVRKPDGEIISFDPPGSTGTIVAGINYPGAITGYYTVANGRTFGFVRDSDGNFTSFDPGADTFPRSINNKGAITGSYTNDTGTHGFVRAPDGSLTSFDPLPAPQGCVVAPPPFNVPRTNPTSINDDGAIAGWCQPGGNPVFFLGWVRFP
jgi:hypothetical protein